MAAEIGDAVPKGGEDKGHLESSNNTPDNPDTRAALERLLRESQQTPEAKEAEEVAAAGAADKAAAEEQRKADEAKAAADAKAEADAKAAGQSDEQIAAAKKAEDDAKAEAAAKAAASPDRFSQITLPPHAKPATAASFATLKALANEQVRLADEARKQAEEKVKAAEERLAKGPGEEVTKELTELREFRQKLDVEADPSFNEFDNKIKSNDELIYAKLKSTGTTDETIKKIQELGGPGRIDWETTGTNLNPSIKRYIEGKIFENEDLQAKREEAVAKAKSNAAEFLKNREQQTGANVEMRRKSVETEINTLLPQLGWVAPKTADEKATAADKAAVEAHNKLVQTAKEYVVEALHDDSPKMKAILVAGFVELQKVRADLASQEATYKAQVAGLEARLKESTDLVERIKKSSTGRLRESGAPTVGTLPNAKLNLNETTEDALARHRAEIEATQG